MLLSHEIEEFGLLSEALSTHAGHKVEVLVPQRGEKRALVEHAVTNAREASGRKIAEILIPGQTAGWSSGSIWPSRSAKTH